MANMMKMLKKAASMQEELMKKQSDLAARTLDFTSGGGAVTVTVAGDGSVKRVKIDPKAVDPKDVELLEDMVLAAVEGAQKAAKELTAREMSALAQDMGLPGIPGLGM